MAVVKRSVPDYVILKVIGQDNAVVRFNIKKYTPLKKLMRVYCQRFGFTMATVRFRYNGQAISGAETPFSLEMKEDDTIETY